MPWTIRPIEERLSALLMPEPNSGCLIWLGAVSGGYGRMMVGSRTDGTRRAALVPRVAWEVANGPIPTGLFVLHKCDNPSCANPDHLYLGDHARNMQDAWDRGRRHPHEQSGEKNGNAKLVEATARVIKASSEPNSVLARRHGVSRRLVHDIKAERRWAHL